MTLFFRLSHFVSAGGVCSIDFNNAYYVTNHFVYIDLTCFLVCVSFILDVWMDAQNYCVIRTGMNILVCVVY